MSKQNMEVKVNEGYEVGDTPDMRYRFWRVEFPTETEATAFFCHDQSDEFEKWDDPDDDRVIFLTKNSDATWDQAKRRLPEVLKEVFGPATNIEFVEKKWEPVPGQEVTIRTWWNRSYLKVKFLKRILPEQTVALEEEIVPEGSVENGIGGEDGEMKRTGFWYGIETGRKEDAISCVTSALKKILGEDVKIVHQHTAEKREGITVVHVQHKMDVDEEEYSFIVRGVPTDKQSALLETIDRIPGFVNVEVQPIYGEENVEIRIGLDGDEMGEGDYYSLAHSKLIAAIRDVLGGVKIRKRSVDGDNGKCLGELVFGEGWRENIALTEEEAEALSC